MSARCRSSLMITCNGEGRGGDHCCYLSGVQCPHLVENTAGRRYACALMLRYATWEKVNASPEYRTIGEHWEAMGMPFNECELFSPMFCCRRDLNPGFRNEKQAREAGAIP